jgi:LysR family cyn operon transcriptional activator
MHDKLMLPRALRYLVAVAEHQSFTRAAEALCVSQPTLSQQIRQLEEALEVQMLDRSGRRVRLTDAGEVYIKHARLALGELEAGRRAIHDVQDLSRGTLRLGITPITEYLATPILDWFTARYPGITIRAMEMAQDDIETGVADDEIDVGIVFSSTLSTPTRSAEIETHTLFVEGLNLVVGKNHPIADNTVPVSGDEFTRLPLALLSAKFALRRHFDLYCIEHNFSPTIAIETNSINMIVQTVALGRHATVLPTSVAGELPQLKALMVLPELPSHSIGIICRSGAYKSAACRAFGDLAVWWTADRCRLPSNVDTCPKLENCAHDDKPCLAARP